MALELKSLFPSLPKTTKGEALVLGGDTRKDKKHILYGKSKSVVQLNLKDYHASELYSEHSADVTVAKYSPSGYYIASGDKSGKVRIWDTVNATHILKAEYPVLGGAIADIDWSPDSQRLVIGGHGRETLAVAIKMDTGTTIGDLHGCLKKVNSCTYRPARPFRIALGAEEPDLRFFEGPPFKFKKSCGGHKNYINCLRFSPDGSVLATGGQEGKVFLYDGATAERKGEFQCKDDKDELQSAHNGGIYALCFSPDGSRLLTASGDKSCKIFDTETMLMLTKFPVGEMQLSCLWQEDHIVSVGLSGFIYFLDPEIPDQPRRVIKGHNMPITALTVGEDASRVYTAGTEGYICEWDLATGNCEIFSNQTKCQIESMKCIGGKIISVSVDDKIVISDVASRTYGQGVGLPSQPRSMDVSADGTAVVACDKHVVVSREGQILQTEAFTEACCVAVTQSGKEVAVGGAKPEVQIYTLTNGTLSPSRVISLRASPVCLSYSPDGAYLAVAFDSKALYVYSTDTYEVKVGERYCLHSAKIRCLEWSPSSQYLMSVGLEGAIHVYNINDVSKIIKCKNPGTSILNVGRWLNDNSLVTVSQDSHVRVYDVTHK